MKLAFVISSALILPLSAAQAVERGAPLASGKPAGVHQAQLEGGNGMFVVAGAALIGITIALATANNDAGVVPSTNPTGSTTTATNP